MRARPTRFKHYVRNGENDPLRPFTDVCYRPTAVVHADSDWSGATVKRLLI